MQGIAVGVGEDQRGLAGHGGAGGHAGAVADDVDGADFRILLNFGDDGERYAVGVVLLRDNAHVNALHAGINDGGKCSFKGMCEEEGATQKCGS